MGISLERFRKALNDFYSRETLLKLYKKYYLDWISDGYIGDNLSIVETILIGEKGNKETFLDFMEQIFTKEETFHAIYDTLPDRVREVFTAVAWSGPYFIAPEIREEFFVESENYTLNRELREEYLFFKIDKDSKKGEFLYIDYDILRMFRKFMDKPEEYNLVHQKELQITLVHNNEKEFLQNLRIYLDYYTQTGVNLSDSGKILKESKTNMRKYCNISEYYSDSRDLDFLKTEIIGLFFCLMKGKYRNPEYFNHENIKGVTEDFFSCELMDHEDKFRYTSLYLNFLKGTRNIWNSKEEIAQCLATIRGLIDEMDENMIVSADNIIKTILYRDEFIELIDVRDAYDYIYINEANYERTKIPNYEKYLDYVVKPLVKSVFFILGTFGLFELYYDYPSDNQALYLKNRYLSKYDGLRYVKLTNLGKYVFGKTDDYNFNFDMEEAEVVLDDDRLYISVIGDTPVASMFLEKIAQKISPGKFKLTAEQFMKGVASRGQLEEKIKDFREKVSGDLSPVWTAFFEDLRAKAGALSIENDYVVIKLKNDRAVIDIIMKEKRLKDLVLRAEEYNMLVKKNRLPEVLDIFREYGYYIYEKEENA
ncbi:MAG: hypothetical protein LBQ97_09735 [Fusobacteriaceae bacterium]|jgi:hypothetical protein|nr:hypothetical protein [Fusobacteriaceae bacterium]